MSAEEYVGKTFTAIETPGLPDCLLVDKDGDMWVQLACPGLHCIAPNAGEVTNVEDFEPFTVTHLISLEPVPAPKSDTPPLVDVVHGVMFRVPVRTTQGDDTIEIARDTDGWIVGWFLGDNRFASWRHLGERGWVAHPHAFGSLDEAWAAAWATPEILGER